MTREGPASFGTSSRQLGLSLQTRHAVILLVLAGFALRLVDIEGPSLWFDEIGQVQAAIEPSILEVVKASRTHNGAMPLDYLFLHTWIAAVGRSEFAIRYFYLLSSTLSIALIYLATKRLLMSQLASFIACLLLTLSPLNIAYAQEVRFYSTFTMFALLGTAIYLWLASGRRQPTWWVLYSVTMALTISIHIYGTLVVLGHGLHQVSSAWISTRSDLKRFLRCLVPFCMSAAILLGFTLMMLALGFANSSSSTPPYLSLPGFLERVVNNYAFSHLFGRILIGLAVFGVIVLLLHKPPVGAMLLFLGLLVPVLVYYINVITEYPFVHIRQVLFTTPFTMILAAAGAAIVTRSIVALFSLGPISFGGLRGRRIGIAILAVISSVLILQAFGEVSAQRQAHRGYTQKWREVAAFVSGTVTEDGAVMSPFDKRFNYYYQSNPTPYFAPRSLEAVKEVAGRFAQTWHLINGATFQNNRGQEIQYWLTQNATDVYRFDSYTVLLGIDSANVSLLSDSSLPNLAPNPGYEGERDESPDSWELAQTRKGHVFLSDTDVLAGETAMVILDNDQKAFGHAISTPIQVSNDRSFVFSAAVLAEKPQNVALRVSEYHGTEFVRWSPILLRSVRVISGDWYELAVIVSDLTAETNQVRLGVFPVAHKKWAKGAVTVDNARFVEVP